MVARLLQSLQGGVIVRSADRRLGASLRRGRIGALRTGALFDASEILKESSEVPLGPPERSRAATLSHQRLCGGELRLECLHHRLANTIVESVELPGLDRRGERSAGVGLELPFNSGKLAVPVALNAGEQRQRLRQGIGRARLFHAGAAAHEPARKPAEPGAEAGTARRARHCTQSVSFHAFRVPVSLAESSPTPSTHAPFDG